MTSTVLQKLLEVGQVHEGDDIAFRFKKDTFAAKIVAGGLIGHCTMNGSPVRLSAFKTLTDWCDTCIQELVQEYVTRFSSWKRVKHVATGRTFTQLREGLGRAARGRIQSCSCAEAMAQRRKVLALQQEIMLLESKLSGTKHEEVEDDNPFKLKF